MKYHHTGPLTNQFCALACQIWQSIQECVKLIRQQQTRRIGKESRTRVKTLHRCRQTGELLEVRQSCHQSHSRAWLMFHSKNEQAPPVQSKTVHKRLSKRLNMTNFKASNKAVFTWQHSWHWNHHTKGKEWHTPLQEQGHCALLISISCACVHRWISH